MDPKQTPAAGGHTHAPVGELVRSDILAPAQLLPAWEKILVGLRTDYPQVRFWAYTDTGLVGYADIRAADRGAIACTVPLAQLVTQFIPMGTFTTDRSGGTGGAAANSS